jgi:hypothetical protein
MSLISTGTVLAWLAKRGLDPIEYLATLATADVACFMCHGAGKMAYLTKSKKRFVSVKRKCHWCRGSGRERVSPDIQRQCMATIAKYVEPAGALRARAHAALQALMNSENENTRLLAAEALLGREPGERIAPN